MRSIRAAAAATIFVSACASHTGIVPMGRDTFLIAQQAATGLPGLGTLKADVLREAAAHCSGLGREMQVVSMQETKPPYVFGNYPRAEVTYRCLQAGDPDLRRPALQREQDGRLDSRRE